ncbi:uncharacterized protein LOC126912737 [Spodoptera frugiperda]|uniref:Uncharacterized protein LOC126912737 n=1 Tax=Spodoptera frugiperda TaxID=7108 RepID=A0A9R0EAJ2_SPOFR|nr:uncharacterized protein LOC126912737 [Spodoptera frugiperda]
MADSRHVTICALAAVVALCFKLSLAEEYDVHYIDNDIILKKFPPTCHYSDGKYDRNLIPDTEWPFYIRNGTKKIQYVVPVNMDLHNGPIHAQYGCVNLPRVSKSKVKRVSFQISHMMATVTVELKNNAPDDTQVLIQLFNKKQTGLVDNNDSDNDSHNDDNLDAINSASEFLRWE